MPPDPTKLKQIHGLMQRMKLTLPRLVDQAQETGDFTKLDQAEKAAGRLSQLGERYVSELGAAGPAGAGGEPGVTAPPAVDDSAGLSDPIAEGERRHEIDRAAGRTPTTYKVPSMDELDPEAAGYETPAQSQVTLANLEQGVEDKRKKAYADFGGGEPFPGMMPRFDPKGAAAPAAPTPVTPEEPATAEKPPFQVSDRAENGALPDDDPSGATPDQAPDIDQVAPQAEKDFGGDPRAALADISKFAQKPGVDPREAEFLRRVQVELGQRPKMFTVSKMLAGLALGAGSIVGAWMTHRYSGQALLDNDEPQREYDARKARIGSEVYAQGNQNDRADLHNQALLNRMDLNQRETNARFDRTDAFKREKLAQEGGTAVLKEDRKDGRQANDINAKFGLQGNAEAGKNSRLERTLQAKAELAAKTEKWHPTDKAQYNELGRRAHQIWDELTAKNRIWADEGEPEQLKAELQKIQLQMKGIESKYPSGR